MTYYNGNPYAGPTETAPLDKWAHDGCLPGDQFETHQWRDGSATRHQVWPWHWSPVWGAAESCAYCGQPVETEVMPGIWRPTLPDVRADVATRNENNGPAWERAAVIAGRALRAAELASV